TNQLVGVDLAVVLRNRATGFYSKPYFMHEIAREMNRFKRYRSPFSLLMVRLNNIDDVRIRQPARINEYISSIFTAISHDLRTLDLTCVWGSDLLAVMLPET